MKYIKIFVFGIAVSVITVVLSGTSMAHVTVKPAEVPSATFQTFMVNVPNEKDIPTTSVKIMIPSGVMYVTPTQKSGWNITIDGNDDAVTAITWSGGTINKDLRDEFTFSAQTPEKQTNLQWKAYQTYSDGTVVSWDKEQGGGRHDSSNPNEGPFSVTRVTTDSENTTTANDSSTNTTEKSASRALYVAIIALGLSIVSLILTIRKRT